MKRNPVLTVLLTIVALGVLFFVIVTLASLVSGGGSIRSIAPLPGSDRVALVTIEGMLLTSDRLVEEINGYADDSSIKAIVLRIDSPGGGVVPAQEIHSAVENARQAGKKVVVSMGSVAASGGYYIAAAADRIIANPGTLTGSIGVKMEFANVEKLLEKIGIRGMVIKSGEYKDVGSPFRGMTDQEKRLLQSVIDDVHSQFVEAVAGGRNLPVADVRAIADGRIFTGRQALAMKLVDQMGDLEDSIQSAGELAGIKGKPRVIKKGKKIPWVDYLKEETASWLADALSLAGSRNAGKLQYVYR